MTSIHHDLDLISQVDGWGTLTWHHESPAFRNVAPRRIWLRTGRQTLERFVRLAARWHERASQRRVLMHLDDARLSDIGLDRASAQAEARKPFWRM